MCVCFELVIHTAQKMAVEKFSGDLELSCGCGIIPLMDLLTLGTKLVRF